MAAASNGSEYFEFGGDNRGESSFRRGKNDESVIEEEEELMWAALSRLPSQKRTSTALMRRSNSQIGRSGSGRKRMETIDVNKLSRSRREILVRNALATSEQDNFLLLSGIKERLDRLLIYLF